MGTDAKYTWYMSVGKTNEYAGLFLLFRVACSLVGIEGAGDIACVCAQLPVLVFMLSIYASLL